MYRLSCLICVLLVFICNYFDWSCPKKFRIHWDLSEVAGAGLSRGWPWGCRMSFYNSFLIRQSWASLDSRDLPTSKGWGFPTRGEGGWWYHIFVSYGINHSSSWILVYCKHPNLIVLIDSNKLIVCFVQSFVYLWIDKGYGIKRFWDLRIKEIRDLDI